MLLVEQLGNFLQSFPLIRTVVDRLLDEVFLKAKFRIEAHERVPSKLFD